MEKTFGEVAIGEKFFDDSFGVTCVKKSSKTAEVTIIACTLAYTPEEIVQVEDKELVNGQAT